MDVSDSGGEAADGASVALLAERVLPLAIRAGISSAGIDRILILPSRDLSSVPFAALPLVDEDRPLIDTAMPVVLPTVDALFFWVAAPRRFARGSSVVVGDPDLSQDAVWQFAALPGARSEAEFAAQAFGVAPLTGGAATFDTVRKALQSYNLSLIYLATHGVSDAVNPMDGSFLALAGQHLTGGDIKRFGYHTNHPVVVMSACQSGLGKTFESGVFGLARAWIHAGASQIVASLWNVDDAATSALMKRFVTGLRAGRGAEAALQQAIRDTRAQYVNPALWGGFSFFGYPQPR
jgi:CHAT domain-containing protein